MSVKHTPEPWKLAETVRLNIDSARLIRTEQEGIEHGAVCCFNIGSEGEIAAANAARIVACVNALAGLNPEAVKDTIKAFDRLVLFSKELATNPIVTCEKCEGSGEQFGAHQEACHTCGGEGRVCQDVPSVQEVEDFSAALGSASAALTALKGQQ